MREKRTEKNAANFATLAAEVLRDHVYGGNEYGALRRNSTRKLPMITSNRGIKMWWDRRTDEYPSAVALRMTDGAWVRYRIEIDQPGYTAPAEESANLVRGYPAEGKP